jgi:hypothetical protein
MTGAEAPKPSLAINNVQTTVTPSRTRAVIELNSVPACTDRGNHSIVETSIDFSHGMHFRRLRRGPDINLDPR